MRDEVRVLDLFAGTRSFSRVAESLGCEVFSIDNNKDGEFSCSLTKDILHLRREDIPFVPDIIWASPPCTTFSIASVSHHWRVDGEERYPISNEAYVGLQLVKKVHEILSWFPNAVYYIENPRGMLRKLKLMEIHPIRHTVTYCQYGDVRMKPTDIWTNDTTWQPRPICKNGDPCHERAPRGAKTGTQGLKGKALRSTVPEQLCLEILKRLTGVREKAA